MLVPEGAFMSGARKMVENLWVKRGEDLCGLEQIEEGSLPFGSLCELGQTAEDLVACGDESVDGVEGSVLVGGVEDVVDDEEGFGVLAWSVCETAFEFEVWVDGVRGEG